MSKTTVHPVPPAFAAQAHINKAKYEEMYQESLVDPDSFWAKQADDFLSWDKRWHTVNK